MAQYPNPLGYWLSVCESHPAQIILSELETKFGSYFEKLELQELYFLLIFCACSSDTTSPWDMHRLSGNISALGIDAMHLISNLSSDLQLNLIPFIYEQIDTHQNRESNFQNMKRTTENPNFTAFSF